MAVCSSITIIIILVSGKESKTGSSRQILTLQQQEEVPLRLYQQGKVKMLARQLKTRMKNSGTSPDKSRTVSSGTNPARKKTSTSSTSTKTLVKKQNVGIQSGVVKTQTTGTNPNKANTQETGTNPTLKKRHLLVHKKFDAKKYNNVKYTKNLPQKYNNFRYKS